MAASATRGQRGWAWRIGLRDSSPSRRTTAACARDSPVSSSAFVISQIGLEGTGVRTRADEIFNYVVKPITDELGLAATRSDLDPTPGQITVQIVESLTNAKVVIADLTGRNPNVYYELGVAHSFGIPVVSLVDTTASLPFDMAAERVIELGSGERLGVAEAEKAKTKLRESLTVVLADGYKPNSLVSEAAQARSLDALAPDNPVAKELADMRDRLEVVVNATSGLSTYRDSANYLFDFISKLARKRLINTSVLKQAGVSLDEAPNEAQVDLVGSLKALIPAPPPPPTPKPSADDDIPF